MLKARIYVWFLGDWLMSGCLEQLDGAAVLEWLVGWMRIGAV